MWLRNGPTVEVGDLLMIDRGGELESWPELEGDVYFFKNIPFELEPKGVEVV